MSGVDNIKWMLLVVFALIVGGLIGFDTAHGRGEVARILGMSPPTNTQEP